MGNLMASFNAGVSGLHSAQTSLNTTSHNLANAHTPGYTRQQTMVVDSFYQKNYGPYDNLILVGTGTVVSKTRQIRNTFLDEHYRAQLGRENFYEANRSAALEVEDMLGELYGEQFSNSINDLWESLQSLSENPGDIVSREQLVSMASRMVERAQVLQSQLNNYQTSLNDEVKQQVDKINSIVTEVRSLNFLVRKYEANGQPANDYRDKRNEYLDELSTFINFETNEEVDGTVTIYAEGAYLLDSANQYFLTTEYISDSTQLLKPVWATGGDFFTRKSLAYSSEQKTDIGSLRGIMVARGNYAANFTDVPQKPEEGEFATEAEYSAALTKFYEDLETYNDGIGVSVVMQIQTQIDSLVHSLVTSVNNALSPLEEVELQDGSKIRILDEAKALIGDDENETMGAELFSRRSVERFTKVEVTLKDGTKKEVYRYNEEDPSDPYSLYTINQLMVNPVVQKDPSALPTKNNKESGKYGGFAHEEWLEMADAVHETVGVLNPNSSTTYSVFDYYTEMVSELAILGNIWTGIVENQDITVTTIYNERQDVMGVSTDEELSNLIKYQRCFDASSRYITTIDEMLEYIIERLGG